MPQLDDPRDTVHTVPLDHPLQAPRSAALHLQHAMPEPILGKPGHIGKAEHAVLRDLLGLALGYIPRRIEIKGAIAIPQHGAARFLENPAQRHVERVREAPQLRLERAAGAADVADGPGKDEAKDRKNGICAIKIGTTLDNSDVTTWLYMELHECRKPKLLERFRSGRPICVHGYIREYRKEGDTSPYRAIVANDFSTRKDLEKSQGSKDQSKGKAKGYAETDPIPEY